MTFRLLMRESEELTLAVHGVDVEISDRRLASIYDAEELGHAVPVSELYADEALRAFFHLKRWAGRNTSGKWSACKGAPSPTDPATFRFAKRKDAVLFKLTWGGS